ncbi:MAG: hypothetical protein ACYC63_04125 [Armatimonadota bacterium]
MICPKCSQSVGPATAEGRCPLCGFSLRSFQQQMTRLYLLSTAFFVSTVLYGGLVYLLDTQRLLQPVTMPGFLPYVLLVLSVLVFGAAIKVGQRVATATTMTAVQRLIIIKLGLIESIAIYGLLIYMLSNSLQWFVTFLALALLGFMQTASQMPSVAEQLSRLAVIEEEQREGAERFSRS